MERAFPFEAYAKAAPLGFHRLLVPGTDGGDMFSYALMCEALSVDGMGFAVAIAGASSPR
jgi:alkylation response protein AidB-like acyl-CoA dehydrogenase